MRRRAGVEGGEAVAAEVELGKARQVTQLRQRSDAVAREVQDAEAGQGGDGRSVGDAVVMYIQHIQRCQRLKPCIAGSGGSYTATGPG